MTHELTLLNPKPTAGPLPRYLVPYTILTIESIAMLDLKITRASRAKDPAKIRKRHRRQSPSHMQPCGDKRQIFEQNLHSHFFSLHHEVVFTKP